jgi:hypothetical protein
MHQMRFSVPVTFPEPMRLHTITSMRDHLLAIQEIDLALSQNVFNKAANIAEQRLGMSSLELARRVGRDKKP